MPFRIAEALGITVALDDCQSGRARYVRLSDQSASRPKATILLRSDPRLERRQWAVAHEIGEHAAYRVFNRLGVDPCESSPRAREQIANQLAGRLLIPSHWFGEDAAALNWDLLALKESILHRQSRVDCPANARMPPGGDNYDFRSRPNNISPRQSSRPNSAAIRGRMELLALVHEKNWPHAEMTDCTLFKAGRCMKQIGNEKICVMNRRNGRNRHI